MLSRSRSFLIALFVIAFFAAGCSHSTQTNNPAVTLSALAGGPHLEAGGLAIRSAHDTAVNFDLVPDLSIANDSSIPLHLIAEWELRSTVPLVSNGNVTSSYHEISFDTIDLGTINAGATVALDSMPIVTFSDSDLMGGGVVYRLTLLDGNAPVAFASGAIDSIPFHSRYRGYIYTTEASPLPIDTLDKPDDGDWQAAGSFRPSPAYPNPAVGSVQVGYMVPETLDSLRGDLFITPHRILRSILLDRSVKIGQYLAQIDLQGISPGLYRVIWTPYKNGPLGTSHGDIMVPLP